MDEGCYKGRRDITDHLTIFLTVKFELGGFAHKNYMRLQFGEEKKQFIDKMLCGCMLLEVR